MLNGRRPPGHGGAARRDRRVCHDDARFALAVVTADCVPVLIGRCPRRGGGRGARRAGRRATRCGGPRRWKRCRMPGPRDDISVLLGPAVSGANYEVPESMAAEVEAALPGSRTTSARGTPALDLRAGIARQLSGLGVKAIDVDPRCTVDDPQFVQPSQRRPDGAGWRRSYGWNDAMNTRGRLAAGLTSVREPDVDAAAAADRNADEIELLPDHEILSGVRCGDSEWPWLPFFWGISRTRSRRQIRSGCKPQLIGPMNPCAGTWSDRSSATRRDQLPVGVRGSFRQQHQAVGALDRAAAAALDAGERVGPLVVYVQISLDGDVRAAELT